MIAVISPGLWDAVAWGAPPSGDEDRRPDGDPPARLIKYRFSGPVVTSADRLFTAGYRCGAAEPVDNSGDRGWILGANLFSTHRACAVF